MPWTFRPQKKKILVIFWPLYLLSQLKTLHLYQTKTVTSLAHESKHSQVNISVWHSFYTQSFLWCITGMLSLPLEGLHPLFLSSGFLDTKHWWLSVKWLWTLGKFMAILIGEITRKWNSCCRYKVLQSVDIFSLFFLGVSVFFLLLSNFIQSGFSISVAGYLSYCHTNTIPYSFSLLSCSPGGTPCSSYPCLSFPCGLWCHHTCFYLHLSVLNTLT